MSNVGGASIDDLRQIATGLVFLAGGLTWYIWRLHGKLERGCPQCPHCRWENKKRDDEKERKRLEQARTNLRHLGVSEEEIRRRLGE